MEKRTLMALAISFLVLGFYPILLQKFYPETAVSNQNPVKNNLPAVVSAPAASLTPAAEKFSADEDRTFENKKVQLVLNAKGGAIRGIAFPEFVDSETHKPLQLVSLAESLDAPTSVTLLDVPSQTISPYRTEISSGKVLSAASSAGIRIQKEYRFDENRYDAKLTVRFENLSASPIDFRYQLFAGSTIPPRHSIDNQYDEANFYSTRDGKAQLQHIKESKLGRKVESAGPVEWIAVKDRHFSIILKPLTEKNFSGLVEGLGNRRSDTSLVSGRLSIPARGFVQHDFILYIGPNEIEELSPAGLETIVNFGKMDAIGKILVGSLELLNKIFRNYGLAIIALTALINLLLFPLTRVSYMSMKRMQLVQPQMLKLREQHKGNPERLNKETMELYRKHKVNPFGGCLPMLLQMPIFIALYVALSKSVILINSKLLWIKDLSSPDSVYLPFGLPLLGDQIHLLPLIMCGAMFFQQKLTQIKMASSDPAMESQQKMMSFIMPIMFGFIFYTMPSGLVLYWLTNTLIMTLYQLRLKNMTLT